MRNRDPLKQNLRYRVGKAGVLFTHTALKMALINANGKPIRQIKKDTIVEFD